MWYIKVKREFLSVDDSECLYHPQPYSALLLGKSEADGVKKSKFAAKVAAVLVGAVMAVGLTASDAWAMRRINDVDCVGHNDYYMTLSVTGNTCWADNGSVGVTLYQVAEVYGGNNTGTAYGPSLGTISVIRWSYSVLTSRPTLTQLTITGR